MSTAPGLRGPVAVIGAGLAGAVCARWLADAGLAVRVFDKSRGVGGRLATRRVDAPAGSDVPGWRFDHGAPGFSARSPAFLRFVEQAQADGLLARWLPRIAPGSYTPLDDTALWVAVPDQPALCRALLAGVPVHTHCPVDGLRRDPEGWRLESAGAAVATGFAAVVLAVPAPQAVALLQPHRADWAQRARAMAMRPAWALMGVTDDAPGLAAWDLAWPPEGPLACVLRNDAKPGRTRVAGQAQWVVQATAAWSQTHLEDDAASVQAALQAALAQWLGRPLVWRHAAVHRWRYATAVRESALAGQAAWDGALGLGWCGDAPGGSGVEAAWGSARALTRLLLDPPPGPQAPGGAASFPGLRDG